MMIMMIKVKIIATDGEATVQSVSSNVKTKFRIHLECGKVRAS
jgi:hypothetical protein